MADTTLLEGDDVQILQAALSSAFSPGHVRRQSASALSLQRDGFGGASTAPDSTLPEPKIAESTIPSAEELWKVEYEANLQFWRDQSAEAREKAEKERARWEGIRAAEKAEAARREAEGQRTSPAHPSQGIIPPTSSRTNTGPHSKDASGDESKLSISQKWETVPTSPTSSYPSMTFPDHSDMPSPEPRNSSRHPRNQAPAQSATIAIFDTSLSARARVLALFSSLAINMLLPFVNGVMLGFGEIFAKNVIIGWFGWKIPATNVGIGRSRGRRN